MSHLRRQVLLAAAAIAFVATVQAQPKAGDPAPNVLGVNRTGEEVKVSDYSGRVVAVTFWASWCGPCMRELPLLEKLQQAAGDRVRVVAVNIEDRQKFRDAARAMFDWKLTVAHDPTKERRAAFGVSGVPHLVIISKDGVIREVYRGYTEEKVPTIVRSVADAIAE